MLFKLSVLAALVAPLVSALTVTAPTEPVVIGGSMTFTWQTTSNDDPPTLNAYFHNDPAFNQIFAFANNIDASLGTLTITVPEIPVDRQPYTIILTPITDANNRLAESSSFNIAAASTTTTASSTSGSASGSASTTRASATTSRTLPTTSAFGSVVSGSNPTSTAPGSSGASSGASGVSSAASSASSTNSAALPARFDMNMGVVASVVLSVFAGAVAVF